MTTSSNGYPNCFFESTTLYGAGPLTLYPNATNVSEQFAILIKVGLALFCLKAIGCIIHIIKPHKKAGGAKAAILSIGFLAWFIALNILIYSPSGRYCSSEDISDTIYNSKITGPYW